MVLPFPILNAFRGSPGNVTLVWPAPATNYTLQTSQDIGPGAVWTDAPNGIIIGENAVLTLIAPGNAAFFRLKQN
jgi:hypothetical protein